MYYVAVSALAHEGLVRDHNEDSMVVGPWTTCATVTQSLQTLLFPTGEPLVVAVADGLGGHPAGEVASALVVQELGRSGPSLSDEASVRAALDACNDRVYDAAARDRACTGMGTTVAGVVVNEASVVVFNVGDSRVYALDEDGLRQLTVDDNPPLAPGETHTPVLTQMVGGHQRRQGIDAHLSTRPRADDCRYLVCTDGLSDVVDHDAIASTLGTRSGGRATYELWRAAIQAGGPDNIALAVVEFGSDDTAGTAG